MTFLAFVVGFVLGAAAVLGAGMWLFRKNFRLF